MRANSFRVTCGWLLLSSFAFATAAQAQSSSDQFVSFNQFINGVRSASSAAYVGRANVSDARAFGEMQQHILQLYDNVHVRHSYVLDSQYFDCVPMLEQPSLRMQGGPRAIPQPPPLPRSLRSTAPESAAEKASQIPDRKADRFGNAIPCERGTIPMRRVTLEEMTRFKSLRDFFRKEPGGGAGERAATAHKYAHAYQFVNNHGGGHFLNLWDPNVNTRLNEIFSLSQHWFVNFRSDNKVQTVEGGWQDYPGKYGTTKPVLFIYWTADGYTATGCYNLDCPAFVQRRSDVHLGAGWTRYSRLGRAQYVIELHWYLYRGNWWLYYGGPDADDAVGYYRASQYSSGPLQMQASEIDFGGETVGSTVFPPMGSGQWPTRGFRYAAYQRTIHYYTTADSYVNATLTATQPSPRCYKIRLLNNTTDPVYHTYFYFGGPGGRRC